MSTTPTSLVNRLMNAETCADGLTVGAAGITFSDGTTSTGASVNMINNTTATVTVTLATNGGKTTLLGSTHTQTATLPASTGSGAKYEFLVTATGTDGSKIIQVANATDVIQGASVAANTQSTTIGFLSSATSDTITLNNTTTGGVLGTRVIIQDVAAGTFLARIDNITTGNPATPWSANVP